jgi:hypothetical protein
MNRVGGIGIEVEALPLDDLVPYRGRINLLKIDVEGYEAQVLGGARAILARTHCIIFEVAETHLRRYGYDLATVLSLLEEEGFRILRPVGTANALRIGTDFITDRVENLIAVRDLEEFVSRSGWTIS